jgi:transcriptional regulator with XRE-family HTH domain
VGRQIAALRAARGWTQEHVAERVGVSARYYQRVEAGDQNLTIDSLTKIASVLGVSVGQLFTPPPPRLPRPAPRRNARGGPPRK